MIWRSRSALLMTLFLSFSVPTAALAIGGVGGGVNSEGAEVNLSKSELVQLNLDYQRLFSKGGAHWKYRSSIAACDVGGIGSSKICYKEATRACQANTVAEGRGPLTDVWRMWVDEDDIPLAPKEWPSGPMPGLGGWALVGTTCLPNLVPGTNPAPTIEMIVSAFHKTGWAKAALATQPKGDTTLVNLRTFFRIEWSSAGYGPGEVDVVDPSTMFGYRVEIRPKVISYVYRFGDGTSLGPTQSPGGVYPDGDVVHTYVKPGSYSSRVDVTFGADFRINGGDWVTIPDTVTVPQRGTTVTVRQAQAVLVNE